MGTGRAFPGPPVVTRPARMRLTPRSRRSRPCVGPREFLARVLVGHVPLAAASPAGPRVNSSPEETVRIVESARPAAEASTAARGRGARGRAAAWSRRPRAGTAVLARPQPRAVPGGVGVNAGVRGTRQSQPCSLLYLKRRAGDPLVGGCVRAIKWVFISASSLCFGPGLQNLPCECRSWPEIVAASGAAVLCHAHV